MTRTRPALVAGLLTAALVATAAPVALAQDAGTAMVRVLHASPDAPAVDIYLDGAEVLSDVPFGVISDYLAIPAGDHQVQVVAAGTMPADGTVIDATLPFAADSMTTVAATNALASIEAQVIADDPMPTAEGALVRIVHLSADAPAVDIAPDGGDALIGGLAYPDNTGYVALPAGAYDLEVRPAGAMDVALDLDAIELMDGVAYSVFAIGSLADGTLQVLPTVDAEVDRVTSVAKVRVLHASPDAPAVDIYVDGAKALEAVPFGVISGWIDIDPGMHNLQVVAAGADPADGAVLAADVDFAAETLTTIAAANALAAIEPKVFVDDTAAYALGEGNAKVRVIHLSADAPAVDVAPDGADALIKELAYGAASDYLEVPAGDYDLEVRPAGAMDVALDLDDVTLEAGHVYTVFAIGSLAAGTLQVLPAVDLDVE